MADGIRSGDPCGFNKGRSSSKYREGSRFRQTPEEGRRTYRPKRCGNNKKDEDKSPQTLNDKNQASSQKFRQQTPEEGRRTYRPKRCGNNNKDEDDIPKTVNDKNQKFRQLIKLILGKLAYLADILNWFDDLN